MNWCLLVWAGTWLILGLRVSICLEWLFSFVFVGFDVLLFVWVVVCCFWVFRGLGVFLRYLLLFVFLSVEIRGLG